MTIVEFFQRWLQLCQGDPGFTFISEIAFFGSFLVIMMMIEPIVYTLDWWRRPFFPWKCERCKATTKDVTWRNNSFSFTSGGYFGFHLPPTPWRPGICDFYCDVCQEKEFEQRWPNWGKEPPAMPELHAQLNKDGWLDKVEDEMRRGKGAY